MSCWVRVLVAPGPGTQLSPLLSLIPHSVLQRVTRSHLWVLGTCMSWGVHYRPRQSSAAERAWWGRSWRLPVAASLRDPPLSSPPSLSTAQTSIGHPPPLPEAGAPEVCSGSCVQTQALQGPRVRPHRGIPGFTQVLPAPHLLTHRWGWPTCTTQSTNNTRVCMHYHARAVQTAALSSLTGGGAEGRGWA